jgi:hypothetical protein
MMSNDYHFVLEIYQQFPYHPDNGILHAKHLCKHPCISSPMQITIKRGLDFAAT